MEWKQTTPDGNPTPEFTLELGHGYAIWLRGNGTSIPFRAALLKNENGREKEVAEYKFWMRAGENEAAAKQTAIDILRQEITERLREYQNAREAMEPAAVLPAASKKPWYKDEDGTWRIVLDGGWTLLARPSGKNQDVWESWATDRESAAKTAVHEYSGCLEKVLDRMYNDAVEALRNGQALRAKNVMEPVAYLELPEGSLRLSDVKHQIFQLFCNGIEHLDKPLAEYLLTQGCVGEYDGKAVIIRDEKKLTEFLQKICRMEEHG